MNAKALPQFNTALAALKKRHAKDFNFVELSNAGTAKDGAFKLISRILQLTRDWADPEIAVISRENAMGLVPARVRVWTSQLWRELSRRIQFRKRSSVENDDAWVQVLACGAQVFDKEVFLSIRRRQRAQLPSERDNSARVWQGCHVHRTGRLDVPELSRQLLARLRADLHLGELVSKPRPLGVVWTPSQSEPGHLGVFFKVPVEERVATFLDEKEFRTNGRGYRRESSFVAPRELSPGNLQSKGYTVEQWSLEVLKAKWLP
ncbi:MAG TPA: hypothetical protein VJN18_08010 [Polyangiaceae bacterium]|nr:hypothetical protein [Polyangiaceae bacterium]